MLLGIYLVINRFVLPLFLPSPKPKHWFKLNVRSVEAEEAKELLDEAEDLEKETKAILKEAGKLAEDEINAAMKKAEKAKKVKLKVKGKQSGH